MKNKHLQTVLAQWPTDSVGRLLEVEVALSGGMDSVVLLHWLAEIAHAHRIPLRAVHVHHGISRHADDWAAFCQNLCQKRNIPLRLAHVQLNHQGQGLEAAARQARYAVFANSPAPIIALAHHADDQSETLLLAALRGGGLRALAAMPAIRPLNENVSLWRPLLSTPRHTLFTYAQNQQLQWVEDESNHDTQLLRNALRHQVLPTLHQIVPNLTAQLHASIARLQDDLALLDEQAANDAASLYDAHGRWRVSRWQKFSPQRRKLQLHLFARDNRLGSPSAAAIDNFADILAKQPQHAQWQLPHGLAVYYRDCLFVQEHALTVIESIIQTGQLKPPHMASDGLSAWQNAAKHINDTVVNPNHSLPHPDTATAASGGLTTRNHTVHHADDTAANPKHHSPVHAIAPPSGGLSTWTNAAHHADTATTDHTNHSHSAPRNPPLSTPIIGHTPPSNPSAGHLKPANDTPTTPMPPTMPTVAVPTPAHHFGRHQGLQVACLGHWRWPQQGERIALKNGGHKALRQVLAQMGVPPILRDKWPIWDDGHKPPLPANHHDAPYLPELAPYQMADIRPDHTEPHSS